MTSHEKLSYLYHLLFEFATQKGLLGIDPQDGTPVLDVLIGSLERNLGDAALVDCGEAGTRLRSAPLEAAVFHIQFVVNSSFFIVNFNAVVLARLGYPAEELQLMRFTDLLTTASQHEWQRLASVLVPSSPFYIVVELVLVSRDARLLPLVCSVSSLCFGSFILVTSISRVRSDEAVLEASAQHVVEARELVSARQLHAYILAHLAFPMPPLKQFALQFGISTTSLYTAYQQMYGCTPFQFYQEERLNQSYALIQHTSIQLKEIGFLCGFDNYVNFYKAFKKRFGFAPGQLGRGV